MHNLRIISILLFLVILFFFRLTIFGEVLEGYGDSISYFYPGRFQYAQSLKDTKFFLWSPFIGSGFPLYADGPLGTFYPLNILFFRLLPFKLAFNLSLVTPVFLAGVFMYLYAKSIKLSQLGALFSALVYSYSGFLIMHLTHMGIATVFAFIPLGFFFIEKYFLRRTTKYLLLVSFVVALQVLAGSFAMTIRSLLAFSLYFIFRLLPSIKSKRRAAVIQAFVSWGAVAFLGLGLAAIQIIPSIELTKLSVRSVDLGLSFRNSYFYPLSSLITFIFPNIFGQEYSGDPRIGNYWGPWSYLEMTAYVGILPLFLSLIAVKKRKYNSHIRFFIFLLIVSIVLSMGTSGGLYFILQLLPPFNKFRVPARFLGLSVFSLAILAGFGLQILLTAKKETLTAVIRVVFRKFCLLFLLLLGILLLFYPTVYVYVSSRFHPPQISVGSIIIPLVFIAALITLLYLFALGWLHRKPFALLAFFVVVFDLFVFGINYNRTVKEHRIPETVEFLKQDPRIYRILPFPIKKHFNMEKLPTLADLAGNSSALFGISSADIYAPLSVLRYEKLLGRVADERNESLLDNRILDLLNVKYILADKPLNLERLDLVAEKDVLIYENKKVLPRAFVIDTFEVLEEQGILEKLSSFEFDPALTVLLEERPVIDLDREEKLSAEVKIVEYKSEEVKVKVTLNKPGILVLTDQYYPGWQVFVNGVEKKIYQANYVFRAVPLNRGESQVAFIFKPRSFRLGSIISIGSLFLSAGIILFTKFKNDRAEGQHKLY